VEVACSLSTSMRIGLGLSETRAKSATLVVCVAEKRSVWRSAGLNQEDKQINIQGSNAPLGSIAMISRICCSNPISRIRSASSIIRVFRLRVTKPFVSLCDE